MATIASSDDMVALVQASTALPVMIFSIAAGALADSFDRRVVMLVAQVLLLVVSAALTVFAYLGVLSPWMLLAFTFLIGCGTALHYPSWQASIGDILPRHDVPAAVALNSMSINLMRSIGPAIGGFVVATAGAAFAFLLNALSYCVLIAALWRWKPTTAKAALPREAIGSAMMAGMRYVSMSPNLLKVLFRALIFGFAAIAILALLPLIARDLVEGTALTYGVMLGFFGVGAIAGALSSAGLRKLLGNEWLLRLAFCLFAASCLLLASSRQLWLSCLFIVPAGMTWVLALSLFNVSIQLSTPRWVVGRALALYQTASFGGMAAGSWLWGNLADGYGVPLALIAAGCVLLFGAAIGFFLPQPEFEALNLDPLNHFSEPQLRLDLRSRSGPIMIMVDYRIANDDIPAFLAAMSHRRRIRIRDGARQWALLRDLENPENWTESYHVATWVEYVRHNQRRTQADADVSATLQALHRGAGAPIVHRMIERQTVPVHDDTPLKPHLDIT